MAPILRRGTRLSLVTSKFTVRRRTRDTEAAKEFWRLVSANGGRVLCHRFSPCEHHIAGLKLRLEAIGLLAEWTLDDRGNVWVDVKGPLLKVDPPFDPSSRGGSDG